MTFEEALKKLEEITKKLESGSVSLDESVALFEEGTKLKAYCEKLLTEAQLKVEKITGQVDGIAQTSSFSN